MFIYQEPSVWLFLTRNTPQSTAVTANFWFTMILMQPMMCHAVAGVDNIATIWEPLLAVLRSNLKEWQHRSKQPHTISTSEQPWKGHSLSAWACSEKILPAPNCSSQWQAWNIHPTEKVCWRHSSPWWSLPDCGWKCTDSLPSGTFARIFWDSQKKAATLKDARQMRWDPIMVWCCLYLRHLSSSAYETLRDTGTIRLPSQKTLRDYTHHTKVTVGFSKEVDKQLQVATKMSSCPEREKCVIMRCICVKTLLTTSIQVNVYLHICPVPLHGFGR